jgi:hypothetical protein
VVIIAETEKDQLVKDLLSLGFQKKGTSAVGVSLYEFEYPILNLDIPQQNLVNALIDQIWQTRQWKIETNARI